MYCKLINTTCCTAKSHGGLITQQHRTQLHSLLKSPGLWTNWRRDCGVHTNTFSLGDIVHTLHSNSQNKPLFVLLASISR